jgi:uroporphyrinogen III methyltransferase/synthase
MKSTGTVYLVGAGPGDAGLLTLRGAELLGRADVVIYDRLVNPELLRRVRPDAERIPRGEFKGPAALNQQELNALLVTRARAGQTVVRLKGGDPYVFGRGAEEAQALAAAGIAFEVVPGITSVMAALNYAGIPLTHRAHCSSFTVFTGHEDPADEPTALRYEQIARIPGTKVVLMGLKRLDELAEALVAHGLPATTPVALVQWGTLGRQQSLDGTLANIAARAAAKDFSPPTILVLGDVVKLRGQLNWFERRPLFGQRVVVTRSREQAGELAQLLAGRGADVLAVPTIKLAPPTDLAPLKDALVSLNAYDWLVFTSTNGVTAFFEYFFKGFEDLRDIGGVRIAAVGPATAKKLKELHLKVDLMPDDYTAASIVKAFEGYESIENLKICLFRAEVANPELPQELDAEGAIVDDIPVYRTVPETEDPDGAGALLAESGADWVTFTSGSTAENFQARYDLPALLKQFPQMKVSSIGPETTRVLRALGMEPTVEAQPHTMEGLVAALQQACKAKAPSPKAARKPKSPAPRP